MSETKVRTKLTKDKIIDLSHKFYHTKWSFIVLCSISLFFTSLQSTLFGFGVIEVNNIHINESLSWKVWLSIGLSGFGSIFQFIETILWMRFKRKQAILFTPFSSGLVMANAVVSNLLFTAITFGIGFLIIVSRYFLWKDDKNDNDKTSKKFWFIFVAIAIIFLTSAMLLYAFDVIPFNGEKQWIKYVDVLNSTLLLMGMVMITMKSKYAFLVFFISGIPSIIIFVEYNQIITIVTILVFKLKDITAYLAWSKER